MKPEVVKFTVEVQIADADGVAIREGSVLRNIHDGDRGVVVRILRVGDRGTAFDAVGDLNIHIRPGASRVTNKYAEWRHIPHNEQTYAERFVSWGRTPFYYDSEYSAVSKDEAMACSGIMALLPDDIVNDYSPSGDRLDDALNYLVEHLTTLKGGPR